MLVICKLFHFPPFFTLESAMSSGYERYLKKDITIIIIIIIIIIIW